MDNKQTTTEPIAIDSSEVFTVRVDTAPPLSLEAVASAPDASDADSNQYHHHHVLTLPMTVCGIILYYTSLALIPVFDELVYHNLKNPPVLCTSIPPYVVLLAVAVLMTSALRREYAFWFYAMWTMLFCLLIVLYLSVPSYDSGFRLFWAGLSLVPAIVLLVCYLYMIFFSTPTNGSPSQLSDAQSQSGHEKMYLHQSPIN